MAISKHQFHTISTFLALLPSSWSSVLTFVLALAVSAVGGYLDAERQASEERNRVLGELALARARVTAAKLAKNHTPHNLPLR